jgi:hypothetical protein
MKLDFSRKGQVMIDMRDYIETMRQAFSHEELVRKKVSSPWNDNLFKLDEKSQPLEKSRAEQFHTRTAHQGLFLCKGGKPDICLAIAYL